MSDSVVGDALDDLSKVKSRMGSTRVQPIRDFFCLYLLHHPAIQLCALYLLQKIFLQHCTTKQIRYICISVTYK